jgi:hypothetical protein
VGTQIKSVLIFSHQLLRNTFVEDFLHGQGDDDFVAALEERFDLQPMNLVAADVRRLILIPAKAVRASLRRLLRFAFLLLAGRGSVAARRQTTANFAAYFQKENTENNPPPASKKKAQ